MFSIYGNTRARDDNVVPWRIWRNVYRQAGYPRTCSLYLAGACDGPVVRPAVVSVMALLVYKVQN